MNATAKKSMLKGVILALAVLFLVCTHVVNLYVWLIFMFAGIVGDKFITVQEKRKEAEMKSD